MHGHILTGAVERPEREARTYALVGAPNVGKSVVFHRLTGTYVDVSNYPGTTVEVGRAAARFEAGATILDTPGALAFPSRSDDERAAMRALLHENPAALAQVADAKHLRRSLAITLALAETGRPMVLALNMSDEAEARGVAIDVACLSEALGIDVVRTVATTREGVRQLAHGLARARVCMAQAAYPQPLARLIDVVTVRLADRLARAPIAHRGMAILFLGRDPEVAGEEKMKTVQSVRMKGTMTMGPGLEAPLTIEMKRPRNARMEFTIQGMTGVQAYDGQQAWGISPMGSKQPEPMPAEMAKELDNQADIDGPLVDYKAKGHQVELVGKEKVEGSDAWKLKVTLKTGDVQYIFLDADSYLEIRSESKRTIRGSELELENTIGDYKEVGGLLWPHSIQSAPRAGRRSRASRSSRSS